MGCTYHPIYPAPLSDANVFDRQAAGAWTATACRVRNLASMRGALESFECLKHPYASVPYTNGHDWLLGFHPIQRILALPALVMSMYGRKASIDDYVDAIRTHDRPALTKQDIADAVGVSRQTVHNHSDDLEADPRVAKGKIGKATVYWLESNPPTGDDASPPEDSPLDERGTETSSGGPVGQVNQALDTGRIDDHEASAVLSFLRHYERTQLQLAAVRSFMQAGALLVGLFVGGALLLNYQSMAYTAAAIVVFASAVALGLMAVEYRLAYFVARYWRWRHGSDRSVGELTRAVSEADIA